jgi:para-nitrobenzyl esterase
LAACAAAPEAAIVEQLDCGASVRLADGGSLIGHSESDTCAWLGVPFAAPPVGDLRFELPAPPTPARVVATSRRNDCIQAAGPFVEQGIDEDCLHLNIWAPAAKSMVPRPVMLWFYGGGFVSGTANWHIYDGKPLAREGVVLVAANYRLGPLGYLTTTDVTRPDDSIVQGNLGLADQLAALRWVHANAAALGGDPANITVFGESAGAFSACALIGSEQARPMIRRAILQSGVCAMGTIPETATRNLTWLHSSGCPVSGPESYTCLMASDPMTWPTEAPFDMFQGQWPVVGGPLLDEHPIDAMRAGRTRGIDLIAGYNAQEVNVFGLSPKFEDLRNFDYAELRSFLRPHFSAAQNAALDRLYPDREYPTAFARGADIMGDMLFGCPARDALAAQSPNGRTWYYRWALGPEAFALEPHLGSFHGLDVPFAFGNLSFLEGLAWGDSLETLRTLSQRMLRSWTRFAAAGDPNGPGDPFWTPFSEGGARYELRPDAQSTPGPLEDRCAFWASYLPEPIGERFQAVIDIVMPGETGLF